MVNRKCLICRKTFPIEHFKIKPLINEKTFYICSEECYKKYVNLWINEELDKLGVNL